MSNKIDPVNHDSSRKNTFNTLSHSESKLEMFSLEDVKKLKPVYITELISEYDIMGLSNLLDTAQINEILQKPEQHLASNESNHAESEVISEIPLPASETIIKDFLFNYYKHQFNFDDLVSSQQKNKGLTKEQSEHAISTTLISMSSNTFKKFKDQLQKELFEYGYTDTESSNFISWRLNTPNSNITLKISMTSNEEKLTCSNFITDVAINAFQNTLPVQNQPIYTSAHIDSMKLS